MVILLGMLIGFVAAIPLGPVNIFIISQAIKHGFFRGFLGGLTTAVLDLIYCLVAFFGVFHLTVNLAKYMPVIKIVAALILIAISLRLIQHSKSTKEPRPPQKLGASPRPVFGVLALYVSNPTLYAFWLAVAGTVTAHNWVHNSGWQPIVFAIACGLGSTLWYFIIVRYFSQHKDRLQPKTFRKIFLGLSVILIGFALYTLSTLFF
jgi:threonine/homoserine/homoserine lactone efflux protein